LVVVAIIAILASLLLPALSRARAMATSTSCQNDFKQIAMATQAYADVSDSTLPPAGGTSPDVVTVAHNKGTTNYCNWNAFVANQIYTGNSIADLAWGDDYGGFGVAPNWILACPARSGDRFDRLFAINGECKNTGPTGTSTETTGWGTSGARYGITMVRDGNIHFPSTTFMQCDSYKNWYRIMGNVSPWFSQPDGTGDQGVGLLASLRHLGRVNFSFVDGHVEGILYKSIPVPSTGYGFTGHPVDQNFYGYGAQK